MLSRRWSLTPLALIVLGLGVLARLYAANPTGGASVPTEKAAVSDVQQYLNSRTGLWSVDGLTKSAERESFEMDVTLNITIQAAGKPGKVQLENDPWLGHFTGKVGEKKSVPVTLTWSKTGAGWTLRRITAH